MAAFLIFSFGFCVSAIYLGTVPSVCVPPILTHLFFQTFSSCSPARILFFFKMIYFHEAKSVYSEIVIF